MKVKKNKKAQVMEFFKKNWKKVAIVGAGVTAVAGAVVIFAVKSKSGDAEGEEILDILNNAVRLRPDITYIVDDNGTRFEMNSLLCPDGSVSQLAFSNMTADEVCKAINYLNPDVWGVDANQHKWDEIIYIMH